MSLFGGAVPRVVRELAARRDAEQALTARAVARHRPDSDRLGKLRAEFETFKADVQSSLARTDGRLGSLEEFRDDQEAWNADCQTEVVKAQTAAGKGPQLCRDPETRHPGMPCGLYCCVATGRSAPR